MISMAFLFMCTNRIAGGKVKEMTMLKGGIK